MSYNIGMWQEGWQEGSGKDMGCCSILEEALNEGCWLQRVQLIALAALQAVFSLQHYSRILFKTTWTILCEKINTLTVKISQASVCQDMACWISAKEEGILNSKGMCLESCTDFSSWTKSLGLLKLSIFNAYMSSWTELQDRLHLRRKCFSLIDLDVLFCGNGYVVV